MDIDRKTRVGVRRKVWELGLAGLATLGSAEHHELDVRQFSILKLLVFKKVWNQTMCNLESPNILKYLELLCILRKLM